jgi:O-antigen ligase
MIIFTSIAVFLFLAIALIIPSGVSVGPVLLLFGCAALLRKLDRPRLEREDIALISVLALYFLIGTATNLAHEAPLREYDSPARFLLAIPVLLLLRAFPPLPQFFWSGAAIGAISSGLYGAWQVFSVSGMRAEGHTNPIQFGNISLLLGILCLAGLSWAASQRRSVFWSVSMSCGIFFGLLGSLLSGSRGSWISLLVALPVAYFCQGGSLTGRHMAAGVATALLLFGVLKAAPPLPMEERIELAVTETQDYIHSGTSTTSVGARLEMWRAGLLLIQERPWLGWGKHGYVQQEDHLVQAGKIRLIPGEHNHLHNEYLDALVKRGLLGLAALMALYLVPLVLFARRIKDGRQAVRPYAIAGVLLIVCYMAFGLTQSFLTHNNGVMLLGFMLVTLWSLLRSGDAAASDASFPVLKTLVTIHP